MSTDQKFEYSKTGNITKTVKNRTKSKKISNMTDLTSGARTDYLSVAPVFTHGFL
jgi:hypothetical protein